MPRTCYWEEVARQGRAERGPSLWRTHSDWVYSALLSAWLPTGPVPRLLKTDLFDETVGVGLYPILATRTNTVVGIDLAPTTARGARARYPALLAAGADARRLPFGAGIFDVVVSNSTLDHFPSRAEIEESLREIHRVLRPGGELLLTLDNLANPVVAVRNVLPFNLLHRLGLVPYYVGVTLGSRSLCRALTRAGFALTHLGTVLHCPRVLAVARARRLDRRGSPAAQARFLGRLRGFERLQRWPTRFLTGYYVAVHARKPAPDPSHQRGEACG